MQNTTTDTASAAAALDSRRVAAAAVGLIFGALLLYGAGFMAPEKIHNAAHDTRHAFTFPCH